MTLGHSLGLEATDLDSTVSIGMRRFLFKERMLKYRELELTAIAAASQTESKVPFSILDDIFNLTFPWATREERLAEEAKKQEFFDIWKKRKEEEDLKNAS